MVGGNGLSVNGVVGAHGIPRAAGYEGFLENRQAVGKDLMPTECGGSAVQTAYRCAVANIVLGFSGHGIRVGDALALHTENGLPGEFPA